MPYTLTPGARKAFWGFLLLVLVSCGYSAVYRAAWSPKERTDYTVYLAAGQAVLDGADIYKVQNSRGWNYVYPPPFALALAPLPYLSVAAGTALWFILEVVSLTAALFMVLSMLPAFWRARHQYWLGVMLFFSVCEILVSGSVRCQASEFFIFCVIAAFYFNDRREHLLSGLSLAGAIFIKVFPLSLLAYFVWRRQWRTVMATVLALFVLGAVIPTAVWGQQKAAEHWTHWVDQVVKPALASNDDRAGSSPLYGQLLDAQKPRNHSQEALYLTAGLDEHAASLLSKVTGLLMLAVMLWASRRVHDHFDELALISAFVLWHLMIPPISESHYFGLLMLPLGVYYIRCIQAGPDGVWPARLMLLWMLAVMTMICFEPTEILRPLCWTSMGLWFLMLRPLLWPRSRLVLHG